MRSLPPPLEPKTGKVVETFNEKFRSEWEYAKEYVNFIAENIEVGGEAIHMWTKPFPGVCAEEWRVPVNKPIWGPRYLADKIKRCSYHRLYMQDHSTVGVDHAGTYVGAIVADMTKQRLDAHPVSKPRLSMGRASSF